MLKSFAKGSARSCKLVLGSSVAALRCSPCLWRVVTLCFFFMPGSFAVEKSSAPKEVNAKPDAESTELQERSVETLTEIARHSVVVVSHSGRDGNEEGVGSGFVVSTNGLIATSLHVIGEARPIAVRLASGKRYEAIEVYAWDRKLDLAIIRIDATQLLPLPLGDSDTLKQGAAVLAMGNPLGLEHSVVQGIVSGRRNFLSSDMIQLAIPIEPGNSGGPLIDMQGKVQGILTLKSAMTANLGFAMPINDLKPLLDKPNPVPIQRWLNIGKLNAEEWTPLFGARWSQKPGRIQVEGLGHGFGGRSLCLYNRITPELPFEVAVAVRLDDEAGAAGLVFGAYGGQKHYGFYPSAGQLRLTRFNGESVLSWTILQQVESPHYRPGEWNMLKVRLENEKIRCYVNDHLVIEALDQDLTGGKVGLAKFRETRAAFKNFQVGRQLPSTNQLPSAELPGTILEQLQDLSKGTDADLISALPLPAGITLSLLSDRARKLEQEAAQLRKLAVDVHRQSVQAELIKAFDAPEEKIDLFYAALLVAKLDNAGLEIEPYREQLAEMTREIVLPGGADEQAKLDILINYLFKENGFHGSRSDYYNRANSYMNEVLDDREGLPITLSILFMELAHRIGLENVFGVALPGHFVVKHVGQKGHEQLVDVYEGGKLLSREEANELVVAYTGGPLQEEQLKAATKREIIIRMLRNLLGISEEKDSTGESLRYLDLIVALAPDEPKYRLNRAKMRFQTGDRAGAKQDFRWLIEHEPEGIDLERMAEIYRAL